MKNQESVFCKNVLSIWSLCLVLTILCTLQSCNRHTPLPLPNLNAKIQETSVSGFSSGGFMAVQIHIAHSQKIKGVGVFAGGPFDCAQGSYTKALNECMNPQTPSKPDVQSLVQQTREFAKKGEISPLHYLEKSKVWLFSGKKDTVVHQQVMNSLDSYYKNFMPADHITYVKNAEAGHGMITLSYGNTCSSHKKPYINNCSYDGAGNVLEYFYGKLNPPSRVPQGDLLEFDQQEFVEDKNPAKYSLARKGFVYVPKSCRTTSCRIHIFLHGCLQNEETIGTELVEHAGYNEWADTNHIIILYPQVKISLSTPLNPMGCWDWWGYSHPDYATQKAPQIKAIMKMVERLTSSSS